MAIIDTYRRNVVNKKKQILKLQEDKVKEIKKKIDISAKMERASQAIQRTKSQPTINSRINEINRLEKQAMNIDKKIARIESDISKQEKGLANEQSKLQKEEIKIQEKNIKGQVDLDRKRNRELNRLTTSLDDQTKLYSEMKLKVEKLEELPDRIVVLFLAMSPRDQAPLQLDEEARAITEMIRKAKHRDSVKFVTRWAVRPLDILQAINEYQPSIIHFSGHGSKDFIAFLDESGNTKPVTKEAIVQTMMASSKDIRLVFFNTCFSANQAKAVVQYADAAIGMNISIGDEAAKIFASQFYSSISFGLSVDKAFQQAKAQLMLAGIKEEETPQLFLAEGLSGEDLIIVNPDVG
jgi:archaellum component FlaC